MFLFLGCFGSLPDLSFPCILFRLKEWMTLSIQNCPCINLICNLHSHNKYVLYIRLRQRLQIRADHLKVGLDPNQKMLVSNA